NLGYNLWSNEVWTVDLLASSGYGRGVDSDNPDISFMSEEDRNLELKKRVYSFRGSGIRATAYFGDYIFQYRLLTDQFSDTGVVSTARLGRSWQIGNWNLHGLASLRYDSARTNQEAFGITASEATTLFPEYHPNWRRCGQADIAAVSAGEFLADTRPERPQRLVHFTFEPCPVNVLEPSTTSLILIT